jgi:hypothetical protein
MAVVLALSGCLSAPMTADDVRNVEVRNGSLPVDANLVYGRVVGLLETDPRPPESLEVRADPPASTVANGTGGTRVVPPFWAELGVTVTPGGGLDRASLENGVTTTAGEITIFTGDNESDAVHYVLAHELVHYVQFESGQAADLSARVAGFSTDGQFVLRSVLEGVAVYTTDSYVDRYLDAEETNSDLYRRVAERLPQGGLRQYGNSQYVFGARYVAERFASPTEAVAVYRSPPTTSEQVIHGYAPGEEPIRNLTVRVEEDGWRDVATDRLGEAFLRVALRNGLDGPTADRVAAGWGNDTLRIFRPDDGADGRSYAWAIRWDDAANATEFVEGFESYLDARGDRTGDAWRLDDDLATVRRAGPDATVVLLGDERFVRGATVDGEDGRVEVALPSPTGDDDPRIRPAGAGTSG